MKNPTGPCTNNTMNENDKSDVAVLKNVKEKNSGDETEIKTETSNNEAEQGHTEKLNKYDPSLDLPIALRKECLEWKNVVMEEMKALEKNNTYEICALPKGHKPMGCKLVFTLKYKADGTLDRHKARLVAKGFTQTYGVDYSETFSPVAKLNIVKVLLSVAAEISQLKQRMGNEFEIKDLGNLKYFIGMLGCHTADAPIEFNYKLETLMIKFQLIKEQYPLLSKQNVVARSNAETEYRAMSLGICEKIWLQKVLFDFHQECETPLKLFCDNKATISIANNPVQHDRTKHVKIDQHFIKERLNSVKGYYLR
ncbi:putative mitochondrial protein [Cucumis melo var. makuwa]|uniref:Putative mitochondrial protein n=1 Tax=Cucumis melo var. makuwa TaxID=1194695 RepID=A0A5D3CZC8_CUCMM|nr:putative mitochondrial protein [Cucumis melo var. makuwa]